MVIVEAIKKNLVLILVMAAMLAIYWRSTLPAMARNRELHEVERRTNIEVERLRAEAGRLSDTYGALKNHDVSLLLRVIHARLLQGKMGIHDATRGD